MIRGSGSGLNKDFEVAGRGRGHDSISLRGSGSRLRRSAARTEQLEGV